MPVLAPINSDSDDPISQSTQSPLAGLCTSQMESSEIATYQGLRAKLVALQQEKDTVVANYDEKINALSRAMSVYVGAEKE